MYGLAVYKEGLELGYTVDLYIGFWLRGPVLLSS